MNVKAVNFRLSLLDLCRLVDEEIKMNGSDIHLFADNLRGFLKYGNNPNKKIRETLNNQEFSEYFPLLNNGITMICSQMTIPTITQVMEYNIPTTNSIIVNGLQTTKVIYDFYKENKENEEQKRKEVVTKLSQISVNVRLYETTQQHIIDKITEATNTQSPISFKDKISNKIFQVRTQEIFKNKGVVYITKAGDSFDIKNLQIELEESITTEKVIKFWYATFYEKPETAKNSISTVLRDVLDATNGLNLLKTLFDGNKDSPIYMQLFVAYKILRLIRHKKKNPTIEGDFIEHCDELLAYGIYKHIKDFKFSNESIEKAYSEVNKIIKAIVDKEESNRKEKDETYSHNTYFKSSKCRNDYNIQKSILETYDLVNHLKRLNVEEN